MMCDKCGHFHFDEETVCPGLMCLCGKGPQRIESDRKRMADLLKPRENSSEHKYCP